MAVQEMLLGKQLVSWKFRGNESDKYTNTNTYKYVCKYKQHAREVRAVGSLKRRHEKRDAEKADGTFT